MNKWFKKLFGLDKIAAEVAAAQSAKLEAEQIVKASEEAVKYAKLSAKEKATAKKEPYVAVLQTHVNDQNPRNGFFELDWNEYFITQLKADGYYGESEEEIIDKWWREICRNVASEEGVNMDRRGSGYINVNKLSDGRSEIS